MKSGFPPFPRSTTDQCLHLCISLTGRAIFYCSGPRPFWHQEPISWETVFPWTARGVVSGWLKRFRFTVSFISKGLPWCSDGEESAWKAGDPGSIPGSGRSPGEGNGYPLRYSCLENSMDTGAWRATVHGSTESDTTERLSLSLHSFPT